MARKVEGCYGGGATCWPGHVPAGTGTDSTVAVGPVPRCPAIVQTALDGSPKTGSAGECGELCALLPGAAARAQQRLNLVELLPPDEWLTDGTA